MKPVYPEILTPDNTLSVTGIDNGDGTVTISIAEGQEFLIQDVKVNTTGRTDLSFTVPIPTTAGQVDTYHLRYSLNGKSINNHIPNKNSFYLISVVDTNYNPNSVDESDEQFDTKYDDMLIAKVEVTDAGTVTITALVNKQKIKEIYFQATSRATPSSDGVIEDIPNLLPVITKNYARHVIRRIQLEGMPYWSGGNQVYSPAIYIYTHKADGTVLRSNQTFVASNAWSYSQTRGVVSDLRKGRYSEKYTARFYGTTAITFSYIYYRAEVEG